MLINNFGRLLLKDKQARMLSALSSNAQEWNISSLAKASNTTYVHASRFISECERAGLVESVKHGRIKGIKLTPKGLEVANNIASISSIIGTAAQPESQKQNND
ncbi:MAG: hypothetical protein ACP5RF_00390 [Candidatus Micrarchaeia archaeon]